MGLSKSLRWSLLWICLLAGCISVLGQDGNVRRVYRRNGNYGRRIIPHVSSVLQTPSRHSRVHEPLLEAETRRVGKAIHRPSNRLVLPTIDRQDQDAEETESAGYSYPAPESTTAHPGYAYQRPSPIAEHNPEAEDEHELVDESPAHVIPEREAEFPQQEAAFGLISEQDVAAEELQPEEAPPNPVVDSPIAQLSDSDAQCNENDHDCWPHGYKGVIRGEAGTDYPILTEIIPTAFDCDNVQYSGYYADTDEQARCQIFHICLKRNKYRSTQKWSFLCPNGTVFDQGNFVCVWWDMAPDCNPQTVESMYSLNEALGWDNITETEFDVNSVMSAMGDSQKSRHFQDSGLSLHQSSTRLKNTIVESPTTRRPPPATTYRPRTRPTPQQQLQTSSRNSAYRIPIRVSDGARDRTALKSVTNNIGDYSDAEHETDESSKYETSLRTEHQTEARYKTKSASTLLQSQSEAYEEKSNPQSIRPFIVNNRKPYVDRDETTTISARDNKVPTVVMMQAQHRYPDGSEGIVNVPVIIMQPNNQQLAETDYSSQQDEAASSNVETPQSGYLPPSKTTEEYDPVEQPSHSTQPSRYLPPATEVIPPTTEDIQYQQELDQQAQGVVTEDSVPVDEVDTTTDIDEGYRYPKPIRMAVNSPFFESLRETTREASGYRYPKPTTTIQPEYVAQEELTTESEGYRYPKPTSREPEYNQHHQQQEISTQENLVGTTQEEFSTASPTEAQTQSNVYLPPKEEQTERPQSNVYLPPKREQTERPQSNVYLPPKEEQTERPQSNTYLPPKDEQTTVIPQSTTYVSQVEETTQNSQPGTYLPPKSEQTTVKPQPTAYLPPKTERTTVKPQSTSYLPPKTEQTTAESQPGAYLPPKVEQTTIKQATEQTTEQSVETIATELPSSTTTQQEAATDSPNAYLPPKKPEGYSNTNSNNGETKAKPATGRAITTVISSAAPIESNHTEISLPGVDSQDENETAEEQSSEESNEVVTDSPQDDEEKFHFPTPATPVVTPDSEDLGTPSQLYNANVRQQLYAKNKSKPHSYEENAESQEKINEIIRQLQAGIAEAEDSNGQKIDFSQFAKLNKQIALVVPQPGGNGTTQTSQTLIFDTSTESITEALKNAIPSSAPSPSEIPLSLPSVQTLPVVEDYVQNPFTSSFSSINTPQYEINLPTKEFESHSIENSIDHDRNLNPQQYSALFNNVNNNFPQRSQPQISNFIQPQVSVQTQTIQNPPVLYNQPQPTQNYILPIASPTPQQFKPQQLFFQPQPHQQEPLYSPPPLPVQNQQNFNQPQQQQNFVQSQPPQQNFIQSQPQQQNFIQSQPQQQNFAQSQPQQQNFVQSQPQQQQNFVPSPPQHQQNFVPSQPPQQNFVHSHSQPQQQNIIQDQPRQQNYIQEQPRQQNFIESQQKQNFIQEQQPQPNFIQQQPQTQNYRKQQADILRIPEQQNFAQSQPQQSNFNNQRQPQQSESDNRYLPPGRRNYSRQFQFNNQQQQQSFQQPQSQATFNQPQIVDFSPAKTPSLESLTTKKSKLINPADIKIVPAIFVHHHTSVENPDGSPVRDGKSTQATPQQSRQQQTFQNPGFYEPPPTQRRNLNNQFRNNNNFVPLTAQQTENVAVTVKPPRKSSRSQSQTSPPPPSPSNVFTPQIAVPAPQLEKFTLDDARTVDQLQIYHKQNLRTFRPLQPTNPSIESSTVYIGAGSGRLDMSPEQSSLADTSRFYPGRDNSLGVKLTYN